MAHTSFQLQEYDILQSETTHYLILEFIGEGGFGKVAKCLNLTTKEVVAIKIFKEIDNGAVKCEIEMLDTFSSLDLDKVNIVRFIESFIYLNLHCLVFEMLDLSVWELINKSKKQLKYLTLNEIRPIIHQLMTALDALGSEGIMHTDLNPNNIMLVDHLRQPFKIKLIDLGLALPQTEVELGMMIQPSEFRAPEVYLGAPLSTAVDMWGLGCIMAHLYFGKIIFPHRCPYGWMETVLHLLGEPDQSTLSSGMYINWYFKQECDNMNPGWSLMTPEEYEAATGDKPEFTRSFISGYENLDHAVLSRQLSDDPVEMRDRQKFLSLLKCCLTVNPNERITPRQALHHDFLTMAHLAGDIDSVYAGIALQLMAVVVQSDLDDTDNIIDCKIKETGADDSNNTPVAEDRNLLSISHPFILDYSSEDLQSHHSSHRDLSTDISSTHLPTPSTTLYISISTDVDPNDSVAADATDAGGVDDVPTGLNGSQKKPLWKRLRKFLGRVRRRVRSIFHRRKKIYISPTA